MIRISELIDRLQTVQEAADTFDPVVRVTLPRGAVCDVKDVELDGNGYVYIDISRERQ